MLYDFVIDNNIFFSTFCIAGGTNGVRVFKHGCYKTRDVDRCIYYMYMYMYLLSLDYFNLYPELSSEKHI